MRKRAYGLLCDWLQHYNKSTTSRTCGVRILVEISNETTITMTTTRSSAKRRVVVIVRVFIWLFFVQFFVRITCLVLRSAAPSYVRVRVGLLVY